MTPLLPNADGIALILAEHARTENGKLANIPYLAVKIAEAVESGNYLDTPAEPPTCVGAPVFIQGINLVRLGDCAVVQVHMPGVKDYVEVIREGLDGNFSHYVTEHGILRCARAAVEKANVATGPAK